MRTRAGMDGVVWVHESMFLYAGEDTLVVVFGDSSSRRLSNKNEQVALVFVVDPLIHPSVRPDCVAVTPEETCLVGKVGIRGGKRVK